MDDLVLEQAVMIQLQNNHFPPVHSDWIPVAIAAIKTVQADPEGDQGWDDLEIPELFVKGDKKVVSVSEVMEGLHLWDLVRSSQE